MCEPFRIVVAHLQRKRGIDDHAMVAALHDRASIVTASSRGRCTMMSPELDCSSHTAGSFLGRDEPRRDSAVAGRGLHGAVHLRQVDAAAGGLQIRGPERPHHAMPPPPVFARTRPAASPTSISPPPVSAVSSAPECSSVILPPPVSKMRRSLHRRHADVAAAGVQRGVAGDRSDGDVAAAGIRSQFAGNVFGDDVAAAGFQMRGAADIARGDVSAGRRQSPRGRQSASASILPPPVDTSTLEFFGMSSSSVTQRRPRRAFRALRLSAARRRRSRARQIVKLFSSCWASFCVASVSRWTW